MSVHPSLPRPAVGLAALALLAALVAMDALNAAPIDPFEVPAPVALGSGAAPGGAHCSGG